MTLNRHDQVQLATLGRCPGIHIADIRLRICGVAGESKWSEARPLSPGLWTAVTPQALRKVRASAHLMDWFSPVETFILNTFNRCRYKLHAAPGWHTRAERMALARKYRSIPMYWIAYERAVSTKVQWTDSLGVAHPSFPVTNFRFSRRCAKSYEVGKENSTDIELYLRIMVGNPVVLIHGCPLSGASWPTAIIRIAVATDRSAHVFTSDESTRQDDVPSY